MKKEEIQMRKRNMKLFSAYNRIACDYLFYYTIDFLFLTQIKDISAANVVLLSSIQSIFGILLQIPTNIIIEFLGRKNSIILGNIINCLYMVIFITCSSFFDLVIAKFLSALAFAIKGIAEPSLLNSSIPASKYKSNIFARINAKGLSGYYVLGGISKIIAGYLFIINGYLPMVCSLVILIIVALMSIFFIEPIKKGINKEKVVIKQIEDIKEGFKYTLKSERLKALIISASLLASICSITLSYRTSLLQDINLSSFYIGIISAFLSFVSAYASKKQNEFHQKRRNKSIITIAFMLCISTIVAGIAGIRAEKIKILLVVIIISYIISKFAHGMYYTIMNRYFRNFTNSKIDTKVFAVKNLCTSICSAVMGIIASFLLDKMSTAYCMIIVGIVFTILFILTERYMKTRVGLKPEEYSRDERKYDELF